MVKKSIHNFIKHDIFYYVKWIEKYFLNNLESFTTWERKREKKYLIDLIDNIMW